MTDAKTRTGLYLSLPPSLPLSLPAPVRRLDSDDPAELLRFAVAGFRHGPVAIATLTGIRGGAARALGAHVVIHADGGFAGFVSGGCVEAAVAAEALQAMAEGRDRTVSYGEGSVFFDIVLPCGGGITITIHVLRQVAPIQQVLECLDLRRAAGLRYDPQAGRLTSIAAPERAGRQRGEQGGNFVSVYRPVTRLVISGGSIEAQCLAGLARCAGYDVLALEPRQVEQEIEALADPFTAIALLHHDPDTELPALIAALRAKGFYLGALGGLRTHRARVERLRALGLNNADIDRIKGPIGMFGPARDANSLAISVLADVAAARLAAFG